MVAHSSGQTLIVIWVCSKLQSYGKNSDFVSPLACLVLLFVILSVDIRIDLFINVSCLLVFRCCAL